MLLFLLLFVSVHPAISRIWTPSEYPNIITEKSACQSGGRESVCDPDGQLSPNAHGTIQRAIDQVETETENYHMDSFCQRQPVKIFLVVMEHISAGHAEKASTKELEYFVEVLRSTWFANSDCEKEVIIALSKGDGLAWISAQAETTGLTSELQTRLLKNQVPKLRQGDYRAALVNVIVSIAQEYESTDFETEPEQSYEQEHEEYDERDQEEEDYQEKVRIDPKDERKETADDTRASGQTQIHIPWWAWIILAGVLALACCLCCCCCFCNLLRQTCCPCLDNDDDDRDEEDGGKHFSVPSRFKRKHGERGGEATRPMTGKVEGGGVSWAPAERARDQPKKKRHEDDVEGGGVSW